MVLPVRVGKVSWAAARIGEEAAGTAESFTVGVLRSVELR